MDSTPMVLPPLQTGTISSRRSTPTTPRTPLSLDLSDLPPLITPSPASNTLLITNLDDPQIFRPENLQNIRNIISSAVEIHSWAPLKSFRRIVVSFYSISDAVLIKKNLDNEVIFSCRIRVFFGTETKLSTEDQHLQAPKSDKLFFISPPPSPPHGWAMRNEEPPNKEVIAEDLANALSKLHARNYAPVTPDLEFERENPAAAGGSSRQRSGSTTVVYHPADHGDSPALPAISVEDTTEDEDEIVDSPADLSPMEGVMRSEPILHTARPPVELMMDQ
ncbi:Calcipressin-domain-containing protein [Tothia fuscella]|uniref:Calcipressin-domain-containing protein n=1 Tax=Tothia fuscella TaxID=1048955 RepID=A0A9P4NX34_9PEZI|nr:Calcipressin-domain-containing protein [Tothia fuscella]